MPRPFVAAFVAAFVALLAASAAPTQGVVSAGTPEAAEAGAKVLADGGNAADAAVAVALALGVTEPADSGLGGQSYVILQRPGEAPVVVRCISRAPAVLPEGLAMKDLVRHRAATIPTQVRTLDTLWKRFGSGKLPWSRLVLPSAALAEDGFVPGLHRHTALTRYAHLLRKRKHTAKVLLAADGSVPPPGSTLRQPALARTLRRLAEAGADDFYTGQIAADIAEDMAAHGGFITREDLANTKQPDIVAPLATKYRGFDVYTLPPPSGGWALLQALEVLENVPIKELALDAPNRPIWMAEALRVAASSRRNQPIPDQDSYADAVRERISPQAAEALFKRIQPPAGGGETTHFTVVDGDGMVVAVTQSINTFFGARVMSPKLGFLYNNYMTEFTLRIKDHPFYCKPGAPAYSSMAATIVAENGRPILGLGSPGGGRIIPAVLLSLSGFLDGGRDLQKAVAAPRLYYRAADGGLRLEQHPKDPKVALALLTRKFAVSIPVTLFKKGDLDAYFGGVHAVALQGERFVGVADPRRDGVAR